MSSATPVKHLTSVDLQFLQKILTDAEYTGKVSSTTPRDVAAKLLVKLFQQGVKDPAILSAELRKHFGYLPGPALLSKPINKNRHAIQGIVTTRLPPIKEAGGVRTSQAAAPEELVSSEKDRLQADLTRTRKYLTDDALNVATQEARIAGASLRGEPTSLAQQELAGYIARQRYHRFELSLVEARIKAG
ncbi:hypothetical protein SAMN05216228_102383 [Rhizobium tibeticum]|uniref:Uncharacterized protein n=1 Tax=Rhizobium tibeticum TaxID=501024 RepID=A0A1H8S5I2_9HYPH|nr:hypothetical protein [Rhizobium tibeticum]SEI10391.1 hypothetical protein RTCCBAU85039_4541 [Rhizobium tibeticum]SEO73885.1 hypothetical protein SAMN05216228_102383 [Rhizobium tibeticum]